MQAARHDISASYAHNDNRGSEWVTAFVGQLTYAVTRRLGRAPRIFFDNGKLTGNESEAVFEAEAASALLFVPILSPSFVSRPWTGRELAAFAGHAPDALDRIHPVELLPVPEAQIPAPLRQKIRKHKFWHTTPDAGDDIEIQLDPVADLRGFALRIEELSARLSRHITPLVSERPFAAGPGLPQIPAPRSGPAVTPTPKGAERPTVFLGQVTFDLEDEAMRLRQYLEQYGIRVLPEDTLPQGGADFASSLPEGLGQSQLFVQLLGPHADRRPKDLPEGYTAHQVAAARAANVPVILWCRPDLPAETRSRHRDAALSGAAELQASGIEVFKSAVVARIRDLTQKPTGDGPQERPIAGEQIFIDSDRVDLDLARSIATDLQKRSASVYLPVFDGPPEDIARDLKESLAECTGVVIVFGQAPAIWVRARLRFVGRVGYEQPSANGKLIAVYLHPPRQKDELGVMSPYVVWVDGRSTGPGEALTRALIGVPQ